MNTKCFQKQVNESVDVVVVVVVVVVVGGGGGGVFAR